VSEVLKPILRSLCTLSQSLSPPVPAAAEALAPVAPDEAGAVDAAPDEAGAVDAAPDEAGAVDAAPDEAVLPGVSGAAQAASSPNKANTLSDRARH